MLPCFTKQIFGVDCPGCGLQRSALFLFKGEFVEAFKMYPAIYPMIILFSFLVFGKTLKLKYSNVITNVLMVTTVGVILINYVLKFK
ncbi:DUF2752 domain-containing protein [Maribacter sp. PR1]|uniref:DUF2752 domain-containing protein n=1 Tax=Maribacter cobaltidurans TaxID=1178778 RepID=A0ABU7IWM0_9FLAO|nr:MULTISPECIES: DUF2752 domain-containing protein [Maribacter]MDC6389890.1 DUF2752 domain-containing protein [Maribacter sp. PR1]MEE1977280.1 DUF2752 domain-containing protein [Maribacter cobaltidurans]